MDSKKLNAIADQAQAKSKSLSYLYTVCPRCSDPVYIVTSLYKMIHYFLDTQYVIDASVCFAVFASDIIFITNNVDE